MPEPTSSVAVGAAAASVAVGTVAGVSAVLGAQVDALLIGLGAAVASIYWIREINTHWQAFFASLFASGLSGYGSPVLASWVMANVQNLGGVDGVRKLLALVIGGITPFVWPILMRRAQKRAKTIGEKLE